MTQTLTEIGCYCYSGFFESVHAGQMRMKTKNNLEVIQDDNLLTLQALRVKVK
jgi:hypothetical protein